MAVTRRCCCMCLTFWECFKCERGFRPIKLLPAISLIILYHYIPHEIAGDQQQPLLLIHPLHVDIDLKAVEIYLLYSLFYVLYEYCAAGLRIYDGYPTQNIINRIVPFFLRYTPKTSSCYSYPVCWRDCTCYWKISAGTTLCRLQGQQHKGTCTTIKNKVYTNASGCYVQKNLLSLYKCVVNRYTFECVGHSKGLSEG